MKPKKIKIGDKFKWLNDTRHVVAFLEDKGE